MTDLLISQAEKLPAEKEKQGEEFSQGNAPKKAKGKKPFNPDHVHLDARLRTAAEMVRIDRRIADVGTDHAFIPCWLSKRGARGVIASDISDGPLACAKSALELYNVGDVILIKSDGLDEIPPVDDVIIAGMGGELIADIVSRCRFLSPDLHFILQPMTKEHLLRRALYRMGLEIAEERTAKAGGKVYTVMLCTCTGTPCEISDEFAFLGKNSDPLYFEKQLARLEKMSRSDEGCKALYDKIKGKKFERT